MANTCTACGAEIVFDAGKQSLLCPFCGTVNHIGQKENAPEISFDRIVPMAVTLDELDSRVYAYMASGDFTPEDMIETSTVTLRERCYVPVLAFKVEYKVQWSASFGYDRQEAYTDYREVTRDNRTYREPYTAYRTVTDWRPANGVASGDLVVSGYGGARLTGLPLAPVELAIQIAGTDKSVGYDPAFTTGIEVEKFSISESKLIKKILADSDDEITNHMLRSVKSHAQGDRQRDWKSFGGESQRGKAIAFAVPICHAVFQYGEKDYNVWLGGHGAALIRADELPVDENKKSAAAKGFIPAWIGLLAAIGSAAYWYLELGEKFVWQMWLAALLPVALVYCIGLRRQQAHIAYSKSIRDALLTQMQVSNRAVSDLSDEEQAKVVKAFQRPERPFFARTDNDKVLLPALTVFAVLGTLALDALHWGSPARQAVQVEAPTAPPAKVERNVPANVPAKPPAAAPKSVVQNETEADKLRRLAGEGDSDAQIELGWMYLGENDVEAVKWLRLAAEQGNANGQYYLGLMYQDGRGVPRDDAEAVKWYRLAAGQGLAESQYDLGLMYQDGRGVPKDDAEAVKWYRLAAEQGLAQAQSNLGFMYQNGWGVPKDDAEAVQWHRLAAEQGNASGQRNLGFMYQKGRGVSKDDVEAVRWYSLAAEQGDPDAKRALETMAR